MGYSFRMTELNPLGFVAIMLAVGTVIAMFVACDWYPGIGLQSVHQAVGAAIWIPLIAALIAWAIAWSLADLWCSPLERKLSPMGDRFKGYIGSRLYQPRHAW